MADYTYFQLLSESSLFYIDQAKSLNKSSKEYMSHILSSMIHSWLLLETYVNHISESLSVANLGVYEKGVLNQKMVRLDEDGKIKESGYHFPTLMRALFVLNTFSKEDTRKLRHSTMWTQIKKAEDYRNKMIHPKEFTIKSINVKVAEETRDAIIELIKKMNYSIFRKKLTLF